MTIIRTLCPRPRSLSQSSSRSLLSSFAESLPLERAGTGPPFGSDTAHGGCAEAVAVRVNNAFTGYFTVDGKRCANMKPACPKDLMVNALNLGAKRRMKEKAR